jgi:hypothetical protein
MRYQHAPLQVGNMECPVINIFKEVTMKPLQTDLSIYRRFNFEKPLVGVKFLPGGPEGME